MDHDNFYVKVATAHSALCTAPTREELLHIFDSGPKKKRHAGRRTGHRRRARYLFQRSEPQQDTMKRDRDSQCFSFTIIFVVWYTEEKQTKGEEKPSSSDRTNALFLSSSHIVDTNSSSRTTVSILPSGTHDPSQSLPPKPYAEGRRSPGRKIREDKARRAGALRANLASAVRAQAKPDEVKDNKEAIESCRAVVGSSSTPSTSEAAPSNRVKPQPQAGPSEIPAIDLLTWKTPWSEAPASFGHLAPSTAKLDAFFSVHHCLNLASHAARLSSPTLDSRLSTRAKDSPVENRLSPGVYVPGAIVLIHILTEAPICPPVIAPHLPTAIPAIKIGWPDEAVEKCSVGDGVALLDARSHAHLVTIARCRSGSAATPFGCGHAGTISNYTLSIPPHCGAYLGPHTPVADTGFPSGSATSTTETARSIPTSILTHPQTMRTAGLIPLSPQMPHVPLDRAGSNAQTPGASHNAAHREPAQVKMIKLRQVLVQSWAVYHEDRSIELLGRIDRQVKVAGQRVDPEEVETVLRHMHLSGALPSNQSYLAGLRRWSRALSLIKMSMSQSFGTHKIFSHPSPSPRTGFSMTSFQRRSRERLPIPPSAPSLACSVATTYSPAPSFPLRPLSSPQALPRSKYCPRTCAEVIGLSDGLISMDSSFVVLGGTSLQATQQSSLLRKKGWVVSVSDASTISAPAAHLVATDLSGAAGPEPFSLLSRSIIDNDTLDWSIFEDNYPSSALQEGLIAATLSALVLRIHNTLPHCVAYATTLAARDLPIANLDVMNGPSPSIPFSPRTSAARTRCSSRPVLRTEYVSLEVALPNSPSDPIDFKLVSPLGACEVEFVMTQLVNAFTALDRDVPVSQNTPCS
ncbi:hypothetical protein DFH06DRAFT_1319743 [Mycena polygramma]|nr:hypothetical protein DFH06DRAFT_1319743 [Mycena polygramma]